MRDIVRMARQSVGAEILSGITEIYVDRSLKKENKGGGAEDMGSLERIVSVCAACPLSGERTNAVFGEGSRCAELMFVGEAPGRDEDIQGRPFVGRAGKLLTDIIEAMGLERKDVYIANILKCRPPQNRNPLPEEIYECSPYLLSQIDMIRPRVLCALGKFAAQTLLNTETPIGTLRGKFYDFRGIKLMPTYHPAYLLRNPGGKKEVWADMKLIAKELGIKVPRKSKNKKGSE